MFAAKLKSSVSSSLLAQMAFTHLSRSLSRVLGDAPSTTLHRSFRWETCMSLCLISYRGSHGCCLYGLTNQKFQTRQSANKHLSLMIRHRSPQYWHVIWVPNRQKHQQQWYFIYMTLGSKDEIILKWKKVKRCNHLGKRRHIKTWSPLDNSPPNIWIWRGVFFFRKVWLSSMIAG